MWGIRQTGFVLGLVLGPLLGFGLVAAPLPGTARAAVNPVVNGPEPTLSDEIAARSMGAMLFVFLHELGHGLIDQLQLPAVGPEEDVVDEFATVLLTRLADEANGVSKSALDRVLLSGALSWYLAWQQSNHTLDEMSWWDEHSPDIKRYYNIICIAYGADQATFGAIAHDTGMPTERMETCISEYIAKRRSWDRLLAPHLVTPEQPRSRNGGQLVVEYGPARSHRATIFERKIKESLALSALVDHVNATLDLPRNITVLFTDCGEANAYWFPGDFKIHMCYELMAEHAKLFEVAIAKGDADLMFPPTDSPGGNPIPTSPPPSFPSPTGDTASTSALVGVWRGPGWNIYGEDATMTFAFNADGSYEQRSESQDGFAMRIWGHYAVSGSTLDLTYEGWDPSENCNRRYRYDQCGIIQLGEGETFDLQASANALRLPLGDFTRVR